MHLSEKQAWFLLQSHINNWIAKLHPCPRGRAVLQVCRIARCRGSEPGDKALKLEFKQNSDSQPLRGLRYWFMRPRAIVTNAFRISRKSKGPWGGWKRQKGRVGAAWKTSLISCLLWNCMRVSSLDTARQRNASMPFWHPSSSSDFHIRSN